MGGFWWLQVVIGSYGMDTGSFGWLLVVMVGYGVLPGGYRWLQLVMSGFDFLGLLLGPPHDRPWDPAGLPLAHSSY